MKELFFENIDICVLQWINGNGCSLLDDMAMLLTSTLTWTPLFVVLFYVVIKNNDTMLQIGMILLAVFFCLLLTDGVCDGLVKPYVQRLRPFNEPVLNGVIRLVDGVGAKSYSFFSAHAANTFGIAVFFSLLIRNFRLTVIMILWSLINCWTRIYLGYHYLSDILVGLVWGFISAEIVYIIYMYFYKRITVRSQYVSSQYTSTGYQLVDINLIVNCVLLTLLYTFFHALVVV